jgi:hypothetical protein
MRLFWGSLLGREIFSPFCPPVYAESKDSGPEGPALVHPGFRLRLRLVDPSPTGRRVEPTARRKGWYGWLPLPAVFRCQPSRRPKKTAGQIEKETNEHRTSNIEVMNSVNLFFGQDQLDRQDIALLFKKNPVNPAILSKSMFHMRCQRPNSTRCIGVDHEMDFLSPVLAFSCNQISVQDSVFTDTWNLTPETMNRFDLWQSRSSLSLPTGSRFSIWVNSTILQYYFIGQGKIRHGSNSGI